MPELAVLAGTGRQDLLPARIAAAARLSPESIHEMQKDQLLRIRESAGLGTQWGVIIMPAAWFPPGNSQAESNRRVDADSLEGNPADVELARLALNRYVLILLFCKIASRGFKARFLAPSSIRGSMLALRLILQRAIRRPAVGESFLIRRLLPADIQDLSRNATRRNELRRLQEFVARGLWRDAPEKLVLGPVEDSTHETAKRAAAPPPKASVPYLPLPDAFVAEAGWRLIWLIDVAGPAILSAGRELAAVRSRAVAEGSQAYDAVSTRIGAAAKAFLAGRSWLASTGQQIDQPPFEIRASRAGGMGHAPIAFAWPPRAYADYLKVLLLLQDAHLFMFLLATGGRISEAMSLAPDCVVSAVEDRESVRGRTYKLVFNDAGKLRDWPLPELAMRCIVQQVELAKVLNDLGKLKKTRQRQQDPKEIWVSGNGARVSELPNKRMRISMRVLGVLEMLDEQSMTSHRFRKTLARLVALAIVGAPKVLMDLFGHKTIEMTLHYMTTDPQLRAEIAEVARAQTIMFAENAIRDSERSGGGGGARLRAALRQERVRLGRDFGEDDVRQLAETLTDNGTTWMLVRPGVLCTKTLGQSGPCNKSLGRPEPSRCRSSCGHRLEDAALHDDVDQTLDEAVRYLADAIEQDDEIQAEMWRGQVLANLPRFEDLREKWSANPVVAELLQQTAVSTEEVA